MYVLFSWDDTKTNIIDLSWNRKFSL